MVLGEQGCSAITILEVSSGDLSEPTSQEAEKLPAHLPLERLHFHPELVQPSVSGLAALFCWKQIPPPSI